MRIEFTAEYVAKSPYGGTFRGQRTFSMDIEEECSLKTLINRGLVMARHEVNKDQREGAEVVELGFVAVPSLIPYKVNMAC